MDNIPAVIIDIIIINIRRKQWKYKYNIFWRAVICLGNCLYVFFSFFSKLSFKSFTSIRYSINSFKAGFLTSFKLRFGFFLIAKGFSSVVVSSFNNLKKSSNVSPILKL